MTLKETIELKNKIRDDVLKIIQDSKATFFGEGKLPSTGECLYELKAEITTNVEMYFINSFTDKKGV